jgi:hypothetical protein
MSINITLEVNDVNTVLEGLGRIQENSARVAELVRAQATEQFNAQQAAAKAAVEDAPAPGVHAGDAPQA